MDSLFTYHSCNSLVGTVNSVVQSLVAKLRLSSDSSLRKMCLEYFWFIPAVQHVTI